MKNTSLLILILIAFLSCKKEDPQECTFCNIVALKNSGPSCGNAYNSKKYDGWDFISQTLYSSDMICGDEINLLHRKIISTQTNVAPCPGSPNSYFSTRVQIWCNSRN